MEFSNTPVSSFLDLEIYFKADVFQNIFHYQFIVGCNVSCISTTTSLSGDTNVIDVYCHWSRKLRFSFYKEIHDSKNCIVSSEKNTKIIVLQTVSHEASGQAAKIGVIGILDDSIMSYRYQSLQRQKGNPKTHVCLPRVFNSCFKGSLRSFPT